MSHEMERFLFKNHYPISRNKFTYFRAIFLGIIDGLKHKLGITTNLNELSNDRFHWY